MKENNHKQTSKQTSDDEILLNLPQRDQDETVLKNALSESQNQADMDYTVLEKKWITYRIW